jgi:hypothetical protein
MCAALGFPARTLKPLIASFLPECTTNGLSVIAAPVDHPDTLAGVFICRDLKSPLPEGIPEDFPWFLPVAEALVTVDEAYEAKRPGLPSERPSISGWSACPRTVNSPKGASRVLCFGLPQNSVTTGVLSAV